MPKILTIGETMAVMVPSETGPYQYINHFRLCFAGAESNTAIGLSKLGIRQNGLAVWETMNLDDFFYHEYVQKVYLFLMSGWMPMPQPV